MLVCCGAGLLDERLCVWWFVVFPVVAGLFCG